MSRRNANNSQASVNKQAKIAKQSKKSFSSSENLVVYRPRFVCPFPQRYRTKFRTLFTGQIAAATATSIYANSGNGLRTPFSGSGWPGVLIASTTTLMPAGFSNLLSATGPYNNYRVFSATLMVRMTPLSASDVITFIIGTPAGATFGSVSDGLAERGSVSTIAAAGASLRTLKLKRTTADFFGVSPSSVADDVSNNFGSIYSTYPAQPWNFNVGWTTSSGGTSVGAIAYEVSLVQDVELYNLQTGLLLDN